jgi:ubiquinone/menaquinone biosynthesis C-methylase UbiE
MPKTYSHNFDSVALWYDTLAAWIFGKAIRQAQLETIAWIPDGSAVLIIGGGTGWLLQELLARKKLQKVVYLEASGRMLDLTRKKLKGLSPALTATVELRHGTEQRLNPAEPFDVIVTHFFLDIFAPARLQQVTASLKKVLNPHGLWLITDFRLSGTQTGLRYWWKKVLVRSMYLFFRIFCRISGKTLPDFEHVFTELGMQPAHKKYFYRGLIFSAVYTRNR